MEQYKKAFGTDFDLGITVPVAFTDVSYKNDISPSFEMIKGNNRLKLWVAPLAHNEREFGDMRYTVGKGKVDQYGDTDHDVKEVAVFFTEDPAEATAFLNDSAKLSQLLND